MRLQGKRHAKLVGQMGVCPHPSAGRFPGRLHGITDAGAKEAADLDLQDARRVPLELHRCLPSCHRGRIATIPVAFLHRSFDPPGPFRGRELRRRAGHGQGTDQRATGGLPRFPREFLERRHANAVLLHQFPAISLQGIAPRLGLLLLNRIVQSVKGDRVENEGSQDTRGLYTRQAVPKSGACL